MAAVLVSCFMIFVVLLLGEAYCRYFTTITFLESTRELFVPNVYGKSWGNKPNFEGFSFGRKFHIDAEGFRTNPQSGSAALPVDAPALLVVGDSVTFGAGVEDSETIPEYLRQNIPNHRLYNASAMGYDTHDYKNVIDKLLKQKPGIQTVAIFYCLNDIKDVSATQIRLATSSDEIPDAEPDKKSFVHKINQFLRSRSKLYLWFKGAVRDSQLIYFHEDIKYYYDDQSVKFGLEPLAEIKRSLDEAGVKLKVFVVPYEAQLRPESPDEFLMPQRMVSRFLESNNIDYYDTTPDFKKAGPSKALYIFGDPVHLTAEGNKIAAAAACRNLREICSAKQ